MEATPPPPLWCGGSLGDENRCISVHVPCVVESVLLLEKRFSLELPCVQSQNRWFSFGILNTSKSIRHKVKIYLSTTEASESLIFTFVKAADVRIIDIP